MVLGSAWGKGGPGRSALIGSRAPQQPPGSAEVREGKKEIRKLPFSMKTMLHPGLRATAGQVGEALVSAPLFNQ